MVQVFISELRSAVDEMVSFFFSAPDTLLNQYIT